MRRILTAVLLIPPLLYILLWAPPWAFLVLAVLASFAAVHEILGIARRRSYHLYRPLCYVGPVLAIAAFHPSFPGGLWWTLLLVPAVGLAAVCRGAPGPKTFSEISGTIMTVVYIGLSAGSVVGLRVISPDYVGRSWVFFVLLVITLGDAGALYTGKAIGKHRLAPNISPNKTVEGLIGGTAASVAAAIGFGIFIIPGLDAPRAAILGLVLGLLGVVGDLFESLLKRSVEIKDTSSLIPGHGGILDRIDSLLFAAPALLLYVRFFHP
jgi:phosphatidate cytidylyltransferase